MEYAHAAYIYNFFIVILRGRGYTDINRAFGQVCPGKKERLALKENLCQWEEVQPGETVREEAEETGKKGEFSAKDKAYAGAGRL